jgi:CMP-N,N'-diacetyllegionaminic acid synthase
MELGQEFDTVTLLQPTSPLRDANDIRNAFEIFEKKDADSVVSVCETDHSPLQCNTLGESGSLNGFLDKKAVVRRQELAAYYRINGAVYIQKTELLMSKGNLYGEKSYASIMSRDHSVDIDEELDFLIAEAIMSHRTTV